MSSLNSLAQMKQCTAILMLFRLAACFTLLCLWPTKAVCCWRQLTWYQALFDGQRQDSLVAGSCPTQKRLKYPKIHVFVFFHCMDGNGLNDTNVTNVNVLVPRSGLDREGIWHSQRGCHRCRGHAASCGQRGQKGGTSSTSSTNIK